MIDDSLPSAPSADEPEDNSYKVYVPLSTLSVDGTAPEIGDSVEFHVGGTVQSLEGDVACVSPQTINGEPAPAAPAEEATDEPLTHEKMMQDAERSDNGY